MTLLASSSNTAKPPAFGEPTALPCPPYEPFYGGRRVCRTVSEGRLRGFFTDSRPDQKIITPATARPQGFSRVLYVVSKRGGEQIKRPRPPSSRPRARNGRYP